MKYVLGGLVMVLLFCGVMSMIGCPAETKEEEKVVAEQYRGTWVDSMDNSYSFTLTEKTYKDNKWSDVSEAYTEGNQLYLVGDGLWGTFESVTEFKRNGDSYIKQ